MNNNVKIRRFFMKKTVLAILLASVTTSIFADSTLHVFNYCTDRQATFSIASANNVTISGPTSYTAERNTDITPVWHFTIKNPDQRTTIVFNVQDPQYGNYKSTLTYQASPFFEFGFGTAALDPNKIQDLNILQGDTGMGHSLPAGDLMVGLNCH